MFTFYFAYQVPTQNLIQKTVAILFYSKSMTEQCNWLVEKLKPIYDKHKEEFEVVLVHLYFSWEGFSSAKAYRKILKSMPWLALPFKHPHCKKLWRVFQFNVMSTSGLLEYPILVIRKRDGSLNLHGAHILKEYGADAFPFTWERAVDLKVAELQKLKVDSVLEYPSYLLRGENKSQVISLND